MITRTTYAVLALSNSGETDEILTIVPVIKRLGAPLIAFTGNSKSGLARLAAVHLDIRVPAEACPLNLAPTASTTAALAVGDALAVALLEGARLHRRGFRALASGRHAGPAPAAARQGRDAHRRGRSQRSGRRRRRDGLMEMTRKGLGMTAIVDEADRVLGVFTDGDLRRAFDRGADLHGTRVDQVMTRHAQTIAPRRSPRRPCS